MASYVTLDALKAYRKDNADATVESDAVLQSAIDAAEQWINSLTQRQLVVAAGAATTRTYSVNGDGTVDIDDAATVTHVNGTVIDADGFQLSPLSNRDRAGQWWPYTSVRAYSGWSWNRWGTVTVTGTWGWTAIPPMIYEACKILARDVLANRDVAFGIAGFADYGAVVARTNRTVLDLVAPFRTVHAFGIA